MIKSKFIVGSKFLAAQLFSVYRYCIYGKTTDIDMFSQLWLKVCLFAT